MFADGGRQNGSVWAIEPRYGKWTRPPALWKMAKPLQMALRNRSRPQSSRMLYRLFDVPHQPGLSILSLRIENDGAGIAGALFAKRFLGQLASGENLKDSW